MIKKLKLIEIINIMVIVKSYDSVINKSIKYNGMKSPSEKGKCPKMDIFDKNDKI